MKNKCYRESKLKKELAIKRSKGVKVIRRKLTPERKEYIEKLLGYRVEEYLYRIRTRTFHNVRNLECNLLKKLHYMNKNGKKEVVRPLKREDREILDEYGIKYYPLDYNIYLTENSLDK